MAPPRSHPEQLIAPTTALQPASSRELRPRSPARQSRLCDPSAGFSREVAARGDGPIDNVLGPVLRRTRGDFGQVFGGHKMKTWTGAVLAGLAAVVGAGIAEFGEIPHGFLRTALVTGPNLSLAVWMLAKAWWRRRRFSRTFALEELAQPGLTRVAGPVRLVGTIEPCREAFEAPGTELKVVHARTLFRELEDPFIAREEVRGVPFRIRLDTGATVDLPPTEVHLADAPERLRKVSPDVRRAIGSAVHGPYWGESTFMQATLAEGDRVEVVGHLSTEVHVDGAGGPSRRTPLVHAMAAPTGGVIWVRHKDVLTKVPAGPGGGK
jgi:hypothetical protein